ncbi:PTS mannitol transporter subunit IICBA [Xylocopilactobacillus apicola]|uniref:Mannitol-specific phosphotransferase enzyme IIA component n=1 Tax=Xylocopilactobacillus apicola TaxID=2932184 RepID=A0AAU9DB32_9LACO|nr:PTS mannitol transporter subunit IICBA [Xylocopilactobacillus apicola]BDR59675.1 PTS mannitol transporter subunit IICBA [Xylocopilactobacillus apicola]
MDQSINNSTVLTKIRRFGGIMSAMVMPNLGAFVGWGLMAALFIPHGWLPNKTLNELVAPILNYVFPLLIAYTAGYNIHGQRGGVIGLFASMGVIVGSNITMISGAMIIGPLAAWTLKKFDQAIQDKIKPGFEMLVNNFSLGIIGAFYCIFAFLTVGPAIRALVAVITAGVNWATKNKVIPLLSIFMAPAQVLFLNNVVNHGILAPIGFAQAAKAGKSIMFLVDSNCGPLLGTLLSISLFGKGKAKNTAPMAMFIAGIAGIGEVYFPFVLGNPIMIFATMGGLMVSLFLQVVLGGGLIGVASPGSLINIAIMTPKDAIFANFVSIVAGFVVATLIGTFLLKVFPPKEDVDPTLDFAVGDRKVKTTSDFVASSKSSDRIKKIIVACDSGMGSSAMGASVLKLLLKNNNLTGIEVKNSSANQIDADADLVVTLDSLIERARSSSTNAQTVFIPINNFLKDTNYQEVIDCVKERNGISQSTAIEETPKRIDRSILNEKNIKLNQKFQSVEDAIIASGQILVDNGYVTNDYVDQMIQRNRDLPVYIGNHVAVPHGLEDTRNAIKQTGISIIQVPDGVKFAPDEVAYVFLGLAGKGDDHLEILKAISQTLMDEANVEKLRTARSAAEILAIFETK